MEAQGQQFHVRQTAGFQKNYVFRGVIPYFLGTLQNRQTPDIKRNSLFGKLFELIKNNAGIAETGQIAQQVVTQNNIDGVGADAIERDSCRKPQGGETVIQQAAHIPQRWGMRVSFWLDQDNVVV